jgi:hypothetical protein
LADKKSVSIDLATGTGKSFAIYGLARVMLAEGLGNFSLPTGSCRQNQIG